MLSILLVSILVGFLLFFCFKWMRYLQGSGIPTTIGRAISHVKTDQNVVALTYDDGPNPPYTDQLLAVLRQHRVRATFFLVGSRLDEHPEYGEKISRDGHEIGNHSWSHRLLMFKSIATIRNEIEKTDRLIRTLGYAKNIPFRAPYGTGLLSLLWVLSSLHKQHISFNVVPRDWHRPGVKFITEHVLANIKPGSIILLHDGGGDRSQTVQATEEIIQRLHAQGYRFVTIGELLEMGHQS